MSTSHEGPLTPPLSPRKRRNLLRSSEETAGQHTIEDYLYRCDPYRSTSQMHPFPYPLHCTPADDSIVQKVQEHKEGVLRILADDGFPPPHGYLDFLVQMVRKAEYPLGHTAYTCLRLAYYNTSAAPRRLGPTKDRILEFLTVKGVSGVHVEIVFMELCFRPSMFCISPTNPVVATYRTCKRQVMDLINSRLRNEWSMIGLFNFGLTKSKSRPTIVVFVDPFVIADWSDLSLQVQLLFPAGDVAAMGIGVEFIPGRLSFATPDELERKEPLHNGKDLTHVMGNGIPTPGTSITIPSEQGGGTLGPFVVLTLKDQTVRGALTNYHVIRPPITADDAIKERADRFGHPQASANCDVVYFSGRDVETTTYWVEVYRNTAKKGLEQLQQKVDMQEAMGEDVNDFTRDGINQRTEIIHKCERQLETLKSMPKKLGKVILSSGKTMSNNRIADWVVLELDGGPFNNDISHHINRMPRITETQIGKGRIVPREGVILGEFGDLEEGAWYCKNGRTTGITSGICDGISTYCRWKDVASRQIYSEDGKRTVYVEDGITEEFVITAEGTIRNGIAVQVDFCDDGDSGSGIIGEDAKICGLLYASAVALCGHNSNTRSGICSTMSDVRRWVENKATTQGEPRAVMSLPTQSK